MNFALNHSHINVNVWLTKSRGRKCVKICHKNQNDLQNQKYDLHNLHTGVTSQIIPP